MPPKSGHKRVTNVAYDEDDVYSDEDYYEGEEAETGLWIAQNATVEAL
jgi:hypothetical protein